MVAAGILASRLIGLVRGLVFARYFSTSAAADAFTAALRIPNLLQNLFGEGVLSASFIPVYAGLLARGEKDRATRVAGAVLALLALVVSLLVLAGVLATPVLIELIAPGFTGPTRALTIRLVRILFPGAGLLVLSAWCLGILNSHRRFFLSYVSPVIWNVCIIVALLVYGPREQLDRLAVTAAWGSVIGCALQFLIQVPTVLRLTGGVRPAFDTASDQVRMVVRSFFPAFIGRGAYQLSAYADMWLASKVAEGAVAALGYAQNVYMLPVSLFGMAVGGRIARHVRRHGRRRGNPELPEDPARRRPPADRVLRGAVSDGVCRAGPGDRRGALPWRPVWRGAEPLRVGHSRRLGSGPPGIDARAPLLIHVYALKDTRTPLRFALVRVALTIGLGYVAALVLPDLLGVDRRYGAAGLTASAGVAGWVEFALLRSRLNRRIGSTGLPAGLLARLWLSALLAAGAGWGALVLLRGVAPRPAGLAVLGTFGVVYVLVAYAAGVPQAKAFLGRWVK